MGTSPFFAYQTPRINSLVFKLADYCNQACTYCYRDNDKVRPSRIMSDELIEETVRKYVTFLETKGSLRNQIYLIWHGGEPLLAGIDKFRTLLRIQEEISEEKNVKFVNSVQTNGVFVNDEWAQLFEDNQFLVGISLDGPQHIHDIHRKNKGGQSTYDRTLKGIQLLQSYNIRLNLISVITNESAPFVDEIYEYLKNIGINDIDLIPCFDYHDSLTLAPEVYKSFMVQIYRRWQADDYKPLKIRFLADILKKIVCIRSKTRGTIGCELMGACGQNWSIGVNGETYPCECLSSISRLKLGNIQTSTFEQLTQNRIFNDLKNDNNAINDECLKCEVLNICRAGCLNRRIKDFVGTGKKDLYCAARKTLIQMVLDSSHSKGITAYVHQT